MQGGQFSEQAASLLLSPPFPLGRPLHVTGRRLLACGEEQLQVLGREVEHELRRVCGHPDDPQVDDFGLALEVGGTRTEDGQGGQQGS